MDEYNYHKVILHIDGDAFFASCEQATNPKLRKKPIVIGYERGAATAFSYEAKEMGISRGTKIKDIEKEFPDAILVSSDYKKYSLYSNRLKSIVSEVTNKIEKTSIDECFADITGLNDRLNLSYEEIIDRLQDRLCTALGITFSIGVGPTKTLAKIGSGMNKPHGKTVITPAYLENQIYQLPISYVPGIGYRTTPKMNMLGINNIGDFCNKKTAWIQDNFSKPYQELHKELSAKQAHKLEIDSKIPKSISKIHAFKIPTNDEEFLLSEMSRHCEVIARKLRRHHRGALAIVCGVKNFDELFVSKSFVFESPVNDPQIFFKTISSLLPSIIDTNKKYRATYVSVSKIKEQDSQSSLFELTKKEQEDSEGILSVVDALAKEYGAGTVAMASSGKNMRDREVRNATELIHDRSGLKVLKYPSLGFCE